jgi:hypothetical protein
VPRGAGRRFARDPGAFDGGAPERAEPKESACSIIGIGTSDFGDASVPVNGQPGVLTQLGIGSADCRH